MKLTAISNPIIAVNTAKGNTVKTDIKRLLVNILNKNEDRIAIKQCPATRLANNRNPNDTDLAKLDINSIITSKGTKNPGVPNGRKNEKYLILCFTIANKVTPMKIVTLKPRQTIIELVIAKLYGTLEVKLDININKKRE